MAKEKKNKDKSTITLPKAWQSVKHRNETTQAKANYDDAWKAIGTIILILAILFVLLGGVSQTKIIKFFFNWSHTVGQTVSNWIQGGSVVQNEDGIYWDPSGQKGESLGGKTDKESNKDNSKLDNEPTEKSNTKENSDTTDNTNIKNKDGSE